MPLVGSFYSTFQVRRASIITSTALLQIPFSTVKRFSSSPRLRVLRVRHAPPTLRQEEETAFTGMIFSCLQPQTV